MPEKDYQNKGFIQAGQSGGKITAFKLRIRALYNDLSYVNQVGTTDNAQNMNAQIAKKDGLIATNRMNIKKIKDDNIPPIEEEIGEKRIEIDKIKGDPDSFDLEEPDFTKIYIGGTILLFISLYLWIFYSSAFYQAIYSDPSSSTVQDALFNPNAFMEALSHGVTALIFIAFIPFVFLGMGYILHLLEEKKNDYGKRIVYFLAFIVDAILAYTIDMKIYGYRILTQDITLEWYSPFIHPEFWLIIFCGYVAYIIWGIILSPVIEESKKMNKVEYAKNIRRTEINNLKEKIGEYNNMIENLRNNNAELSGEILNLKSSLDNVVVSFADFKPAGDEYVMGWDNYNRGAGLDQEERDDQLQWYQEVLDRLREGGNANLFNH